jgi:hypothetical protein
MPLDSVNLLVRRGDSCHALATSGGVIGRRLGLMGQLKVKACPLPFGGESEDKPNESAAIELRFRLESFSSIRFESFALSSFVNGVGSMLNDLFCDWVLQDD